MKVDANMSLAPAMANREIFRELGLVTIGVVSIPRAGKTMLLERTLPLLKKDFNLAVLETDLEPFFDAERIRSAGVPVWQIVTGADRWAEAGMVPEALRQFPVQYANVLIIERVIDPDVGSLPDWGEHLRVLVHRVSPRGEVPGKILSVCREADAVLLNTIDCPRRASIVCDEVSASIIGVNPAASIFHVAESTDQGLLDWADWLRVRIRALQCAAAIL
jgi:hydrogenase nickel incorporation protein HypB